MSGLGQEESTRVDKCLSELSSMHLQPVFFFGYRLQIRDPFSLYVYQALCLSISIQVSLSIKKGRAPNLLF